MSRASEAAIAAAEAGRREAAVALVRSCVAAGDLDGVSLLGHWHLAGDIVPRDLAAARVLLARAVDAGHEGAAFTHIALTANGAYGTADWPGAVAMLRALAARHGGEAQRQLALLSRMDIDAQGTPRAVPEPQVPGSDALVRHWRALLSAEECAMIALSARDLLAPSFVAHPVTGQALAHPVRSSSAAVIGPTRESLPIQAINRRIAAATGTAVGQGEALTVLHYAPGQQYRPHVDTLPGEGNQRVLTVIVYLNEGYEGGETQFPASGLTVAARAGDAIAFANVDAAGQPDPVSRHAGLPIRRGAKWVATRWIRARRFDPWNPTGRA